MVHKVFLFIKKKIKLNKRIYNISTLIDIFINLYDNGNINCNKRNRNKLYNLYNDIVLNKFVHSNKYKNSTVFTIYK